jgi:hypothetical protein
MSEKYENITLLYLKNGQHVITALTELTTQEGDPYCFMLEVPMTVTFGSEPLQIKLSPWSPFSKSLAFRVPFDFVVTLSEPKDEIKQKYLELVVPEYPINETAEIITGEKSE